MSHKQFLVEISREDKKMGLRRILLTSSPLLPKNGTKHILLKMFSHLSSPPSIPQIDISISQEISLCILSA
jgi:hypothetical protein